MKLSRAGQMLLTVRDLSVLLRVPEGTVYRWIGEEGLPACEVNGRHCADSGRLAEWLVLHSLPVSGALLPSDDGLIDRLDDALLAGAVAYELAGSTRADALADLAELIPPVLGLGRAGLLALLRCCEDDEPALLAEGIAVPASQRPLVAPGSAPVLALGFLNRPVPWGPHGETAHTVFVLTAPTADQYLRLLARLAFALRQPGFRDALRRQVPEWELLAAARAVDEVLAPPRPFSPGRLT